MHARDIFAVGFNSAYGLGHNEAVHRKAALRAMGADHLASVYLGVEIHYRGGKFVYQIGSIVSECGSLTQAMSAIEGTLENLTYDLGKGDSHAS